MHETVVEILNIVGIDFQKLNDNSDQLIIYRDTLIDPEKYKVAKEKIDDLKKFFSSSFLTSLQENAHKKQKWPLLNLVRQLLKTNMYEMKPIRKSDGYTKDGKKKYIRFFLIQKVNSTTNEVSE
tara:strand:+ start:10555 stop:10926 length:372 start_codon:yes stop_codon:yes gene_type:complete